MFGPLGIWEILLILGIALLIFGPRKLPEIGRTLGRSLGEFRRATTDLKRSIELEIDQDEWRPDSSKKPDSTEKPEPSSPKLTAAPAAVTTVPTAVSDPGDSADSALDSPAAETDESASEKTDSGTEKTAAANAGRTVARKADAALGS